MITCIKCKEEFENAPKSGESSEDLVCPHCHSRFRIKWKMEMELADGGDSQADHMDHVVNHRPSGVKILVAVDGEATQDIMKEVLTAVGHEVLLASTGQEALSILEREHPKIAYLDVALPQVLGFEVCEIIKKSPKLKSTKVILVSAIYDKTRYKRAPTSLYGADDYIERHHIQDGLLLKLNKLLTSSEEGASGPETPILLPELAAEESSASSNGNGEKPFSPESVTSTSVAPISITPPSQPEPEPLLMEMPDAMESEVINEPTAPNPSLSASENDSESILENNNESLSGPEIGSDLEVEEIQPSLMDSAPVLSPEEKEKHEEARRFARLIISDIALYNQKEIENGIENGNLEELLKDDMAEAEKLYRERVSKEIREKTHYLQEALRDLVERKSKTMKHGA